MIGIAFLLGLISFVLFCTGKLSPFGIVVAKAADTALSTAGCSLGSAGLTAVCCKIKEMYTRYKSSVHTFTAELARVGKELALVTLPFSSPKLSGRSTHASLEFIGGTAPYYKKPHPIIAPPVGVPSFAWWQCQYHPQHPEKIVAVNRLGSFL